LTDKTAIAEGKKPRSHVLLTDQPTDTVLADKGYGADARVMQRNAPQGKTAATLPKCNPKTLQDDYLIG
jgi:hypothetical protein